MESTYPPLGVEEVEEMLARRRAPSRNEMRAILVRALSTAKQLRELRSAYDLEMRARVAAAGSGRRAYLDPAQVVAFLSKEQRSKLLSQMEKDRLEAHEHINQKLQEKVQEMSDLMIAVKAVLEESPADSADALTALLEQMRSTIESVESGPAVPAQAGSGEPAAEAAEIQDEKDHTGRETPE